MCVCVEDIGTHCVKLSIKNNCIDIDSESAHDAPFFAEIAFRDTLFIALELHLANQDW